MKDHPITTKAGKRQFIKQLSKSMELKFLDKIDHIPDNWNGIEIRAWMATDWERENPFKHHGAILDEGLYRAHQRRARIFKNDLATRPL
jgi:hypothetical protein